MDKLKEWNTPKNRLMASVIFGWTVILFNLVIFPLATEGEGLLTGILIAGILLSIRYSMMRPVLKTAAAGAGFVGIGMIIESIFPREGNGFAIGALIGALFMLFIVLIKNIIVSLWYLSNESFSLYQLYQKKNIGSEV